MQIMKHEDHGFCHAYSSGEVDRLKKLGWTEATENDQKKPGQVEQAEPKRRGRPPKGQ